MHPILFSAFGFSLYAYGLLVALACGTATLWGLRRARAKAMDETLFLQVLLWMFVGGFVGARLLYFAYDPSVYLHAPLRIILDRGGFVWYGGLIGGGLSVAIMALKYRFSLWTFGDILASPTALGLAIGRVGCFLTGCCYGKPTTLPWGVVFPTGHPTHPLHVHPSQLYETALLLAFLPILAWVWRHKPTSGTTFATMCIGMGLIRFLIEWTRGDGLFWIGHWLTASQTISLGVILLGIVVLFSRNRITLAPQTGATNR